MGRVRIRGALIVAACVAAIASGGVTAGAASHGPGLAAPSIQRPRLAVSGNAAAIAFYRKVAAATDAMTSDHFTYSAAQTLVTVENVGGRLSWLMASPPRAGYHPAHGEVWASTLNGKLTFVAETVAPSSPADGYTAFELVLTPRGEVMMSATPVAGVLSCRGATTGHPYVGLENATGRPIGYSVVGRFSPLRRQGNTVFVTSRYDWGSQPAIEVDTVSATTYLPSRSVYHILPAHGHPGFTFAQDNVTWATTPLTPPRSNGVCATYLASIP